MTDALFRLEAGKYLPSPDTCGPWGSDRMHGGPVFGLLARTVEAVLPDPAFLPARFTFDLYRAVPLVPLEAQARIIQQSKRLCIVRAALLAGGDELVGATVVLLRQTEGAASQPSAATPPGPDGLDTQHLIPGLAADSGRRGYHVRVETRRPARAEGEPLTIWFRMPLPLVEGFETTALQRAVQLSDFTNAVASFAQHARGEPASFINVDATLHLSRRPTGEWLCIQAADTAVDQGISIATCRLYDTQGECGRATQSRLENRMPR